MEIRGALKSQSTHTIPVDAIPLKRRESRGSALFKRKYSVISTYGLPYKNQVVVEMKFNISNDNNNITDQNAA